MHVCHFCDSSVDGDYFRNIAGGLSRKGVRVTLVELGPGSPPSWLGSVPNTAYFSLNAAAKWQYPFAVRQLAQIIGNNEIDILHTHLFYAGIIGILVKRFRRKTVVALMRHHTGVVRMLGSRLHIWADKWMAEKADRVMTVSREARRYMVEVDQIKREDIDVVYLGFDFKKYSPDVESGKNVRREFGFADDDLVMGYVGNFANGKGHAQLIEAFEKILNEIPRARLFFVGRGTLAEVERAAARFPKDKIILAGWRDDIPACLNAMDVFVQPSLSEAFSQVLIEAMGTGLPVIATNVGGANEVIDSGINGILVEPDDPDAISAEVCRLYHDAPFTSELAKAGIESVRERFAVDQMVERQFDLYQCWMGLH